jgi:hypothetical protein
MYSRIQTSDNFWTGIDMIDLIHEPQEIAQTIEPIASDETVPLRCSVIGCPEQQLFSTKSALK